MSRKRQLTPAQKEVLIFIMEFTDEYPYPPTYSQIGEYISKTPENARQLVTRLVKKGFLKKMRGVSRALEVTPKVEEIVDELSK